MPEKNLRSLQDLVRWGASEFGRAGLSFGHGTDNALDEARHLVLWALDLPLDLPDDWLTSRVTAAERRRALALLQRRVRTRKPAAYLTGEAWFAGLPFTVDERVIVPRSPFAELIRNDFQPWLETEPRRILDLCAGSGCIAIACADQFPDASVDAVELDADAFDVLQHNITRHGLSGRVRALRSDLYRGVGRRSYDLIVTNPPYIPTRRWKDLPPEYRHEPQVALEAGHDGMRLVRRILAGAAARLARGGLLACEVGGSVREFEARFPDLPVDWPLFEHGGSGVFSIGAAALSAWTARGAPRGATHGG